MCHQILHIHIYSVATRSGEPHNALHSSSIIIGEVHKKSTTFCTCRWYIYYYVCGRGRCQAVTRGSASAMLKHSARDTTSWIIIQEVMPLPGKYWANMQAAPLEVGLHRQYWLRQQERAFVLPFTRSGCNYSYNGHNICDRI